MRHTQKARDRDMERGRKAVGRKACRDMGGRQGVRHSRTQGVRPFKIRAIVQPLDRRHKLMSIRTNCRLADRKANRQRG